MYMLADFAQEQKVQVKQHQRLQNGRLVTVQSFDSTRRKKEGDTGRKILITAAVLGGMLGAGFLAAKGATGAVRADVVKKADAGIDEALKATKTVASKTRDLKYKDADIVIAVNGLNGATKETDEFNEIAQGLDTVLNSGNKKINVVPFTIAYDLTGIDVTKKPNPLNVVKTFQNVLHGKKTNEKTAELVRTVEAYQAKYPNKRITVLGFSMGGYVATNAAVKLNNPKIQTIAIAAPNLSRREPPNYIAVRAKNDDVVPGIAFTGKEVVLDDVPDGYAHVNTLASKKGLALLKKKLFGD